MNVEKIVTSLEVSKKMKDEGFEQDTVFYWMTMPNGKTPLVQGKVLLAFNQKYNPEIEYYPAPTPSEIELPDKIKGKYDLLCYKLDNGHWMCSYETFSRAVEYKCLKEFQGETLQDCMGLMWYYLKKEGLLIP